MHSVFVVGRDSLVTRMFDDHPYYDIVHQPKDADILCFTGGADVHPSFYGENPIPGCAFNKTRDDIEKKFFEEFPDKFHVGVCRGGQFLNVLSGGKMFQDVDGHAGCIHRILDELEGKYRLVNSTHHQMMIPGPNAFVLAQGNESTYRLAENVALTGDDITDWTDTEVVWYEDTNSLCFQPHPEYGHEPTHEYFFEIMTQLTKAY